MTVTQLRTDLRKKKPVMGAKRTLKLLKIGNLEKVYIAKNCREDIRKDIEHYAELANVELIKLDITNDELGVVCKKPFNISVLSFEK